MNNVLRIFEVVAKEEDLKIGALEKTIGASKGVLSRAINNQTDVQSKWFLALVEKFPHYNYTEMLKGKFSTPKVLKREEEERIIAGDEASGYPNATLEGLRSDLNEFSKGVTRNFEVVSEGIMRGLKDQQKILDFIKHLDAKEISTASKGLNEFLKEKKE